MTFALHRLLFNLPNLCLSGDENNVLPETISRVNAYQRHSDFFTASEQHSAVLFHYLYEIHFQVIKSNNIFIAGRLRGARIELKLRLEFMPFYETIKQAGKIAGNLTFVASSLAKIIKIDVWQMVF